MEPTQEKKEEIQKVENFKLYVGPVKNWWTYYDRRTGSPFVFEKASITTKGQKLFVKIFMAVAVLIVLWGFMINK